MIRITGGTNRSRLLTTPNSELTKPTMDKVRAAVFSALGDAVKNAKVLDLFAGSGSYGFEALSRGANSAVFVDKSRDAFNAVKENAKNLGYQNVELIFGDSLEFLRENPRKFSIVFVDPPYKLDVYERVVETLIKGNMLEDNGIIVLESERELNLDNSLFNSVRFYKYGLAKIYIIRK